jgi:hypothetical protein
MNSNANAQIHERLFPALSPESAAAMAALLKTINEVRPLPQKRRKSLPFDIRDLWASLTSERETRKGAYLSAPETLSAYLRYFLPWNVYRYLRLLPALDLGFLGPGSVILDLGAGPLSVAIALFIAKPELRPLPLTVYAVDRAPQSMEAGAEILAALSLALEGKLPAWKVIRIHGDAEASIKQKADLVTAGYFLNEFGRREATGLGERAGIVARIMQDRIVAEGRILVLEAGEARSASLVSALRESLIDSGFLPISPCPHAQPCPMPGFFYAKRSSGPSGAAGEGKELIRDDAGRPLVLASGKRPWCHFCFDAKDAPAELLSLSQKAGLPKEGASLSFLFARRTASPAPSPVSAGLEAIRVVSESFPLPESLSGRYACGHSGYILVRSGPGSGEWREVRPGDLLNLDIAASPGKDPKTRALLVDFDRPHPASGSRLPDSEPDAMPPSESQGPERGSPRGQTTRSGPRRDDFKQGNRGKHRRP